MAVVDQLNLNVGTEQNPNFVLHDINDKRISTTAVTTATHLLTCNSGVTSIAPITAANLASVLGGQVINKQSTPIGDFNDRTDIATTLELSNSSTLHSPYTGDQTFILKVESGAQNRRIQRTFSFDTGSEHVRYKNNLGVWSSWKQITLT